MQRATNWMRKITGEVPFFQSPLFKPYTLLVILAFIIGLLLRVWDFGNLPPGLAPDEVSIAVEAASLHYYGIDRNGISYPVHFVSWGSGQNVPYAYLLAPLVPLGLTPAVIRFPMLVAGMLTLAIVYAIAKKLFTPSIALLAVFLMAISPWHISISRWALDANLFPFVFSLAFLSYLYLDRHPVWFFLSMIVFAFCMYVYGAAYLVVTLFILFTGTFLLRKPVISKKNLIIGLTLFGILTAPIILFILINIFQWNEIHLGLVTIPRMIDTPRIIEMNSLLEGGGRSGYYNLLTMAKILFLHTDEITGNFIPPFGYLFPGAILFSLMGTALIVEKIYKERQMGLWGFAVWLALSFGLGINVPPVVYRINIIFIPLILCAAVALEWCIRDKKILAIAMAIGIGAYGVLYWREYTGLDYRREVGWSFNDGLIAAVQSVKQIPEAPVCITNEMAMPYVYVMLADIKNPLEYLANIEYLEPIAKYRVVTKMGRYSFGIQNCAPDPQTIYILKSDQTLPLEENLFSAETFENYVVYIPLKVE